MLTDETDEIKENLYYGGYFAASIFWDSDVSLGSIALKLQNSNLAAEAESIWPSSCKLLFSLRGRKIEVNRADITSPIGIGSHANDLNAKLAHCGIWTPSPQWNDSVLDHFEFLINQKNIEEKDIQKFFEIYPDFILDDLHVEAIPQVFLFQEQAKNIKVDFMVRKIESNFIDIVELKKPNARLIVGTKDRPRFSSQVAMAIAQLKQYRDWFRDGTNRKWFRNTYGLEGFEPRMTLIIGRRPKWANDRILAKCKMEYAIDILTYDDLYSVVKRRKEWLA